MISKSMYRTYLSTILRRRLPETVAVILTLLFVGAMPPIEAEVVNRIVLRVNDEIVTLLDYQGRLAQRLNAIRDADLDAEARRNLEGEAGKSVLRDMLDELLLLSRADQLNIRADDAQIEGAMANAREGAGIKTEEEFRIALEQSGLTMDSLRARMEKNIVLQMIMGREVQSRIRPSEEEGLRYYRDHKENYRVPDRISVREVVVLESQDAPGSGRGLAESILEEVRGGKDFAEVIEPHQALGSTTGVIEHGWVATADLDPALAEAVTDLEVGGYSEPIAARGGLHILQVQERKESHIQPFKEVSGAIMATIQAERFDETLSQYMAELEAAAYIRSEPPQEAVGFRVARGKQMTMEELLQMTPETASEGEGDVEPETEPKEGDG